MNDRLKTIINFTKDCRILLVEDDDILRASMQDLLGSFFKIVDIAENGAVALSKFNESNQYDVIFTDINMPKLNGWDMIEQMKSIKKAQQFVIMSACDKNVSIDKAKDLDIAHYLTKPITNEHLYDTLYTISIEHSTLR